MITKRIYISINKNVIIGISVFVSALTLLCGLITCNKRTDVFRKLEEITKFLCHVPLFIFGRKRKIILPEINKNVEINLSDDELEKQFAHACNGVKLYRNKMKLEQWLLFYGLYKNSLCSNDNLSNDEEFLDFVNEANEVNNTVKVKKNDYLEKEKKNAVKHCHGINEKRCKFLYITYFNNLFPEAITNITNNENAMISTNLCVSKIKKDKEDFVENSLCDAFCYDVVLERTENVKKTLTEYPYLVNEKNSDGLTALHYACDRGFLEIAKLLIENGACVDVEDASGDTPLHMAAYSEQTKIIDYLLTVGANVNKKNKEGLTMHDILNEM